MVLTTPKSQLVGPFVMLPLVAWQKSNRTEWAEIDKQVDKLRNAMKQIDQELGRCRGTGPAELVCKKIEKRRRLHDHLTLACMRYDSYEKTQTMIQSTIDTAIESYARSSCLQLTRAINTTLPGEIRDIIYTHLLDASTLSYINDQVQYQLKWDCCAHTLCEFDYFHFMDPSFVGAIATQEILEVVAKGHVGVHPESFRPKNPRAFVSMDALHLGVVPVSAFYMDLTFFFPLNTLFDIWHHNMSRCRFAKDPGTATDGFIFHLRKLLLDIPLRRKRTLTMKFSLGGLEDVRVKLLGIEAGKKEYVKTLRREVEDTLEGIREMGFKKVCADWLDTEKEGDRETTRKGDHWSVCDCATTRSKKMG